MSRLWTSMLLGGSLAGVLGSLPLVRSSTRPLSQVLVLMGDTDGYLAPCGCTKPMTGGIRRRATAVRALTEGLSATVLENGGLVSGTGRQDYLKAEAMGEVLRVMQVDAANLTPSEAKLGQGLVQSLRNLAGEVFLQSNLRDSPTNSIARFIPSGPFLIGGVSTGHEIVQRALGEASDSNDEAAKVLVEMAKERGLQPILMVDDGIEEATRIAKTISGLKLIQYRSTGRPLPAPRKIGETVLASPGEKGKYVLRLLFEDGELKAYAPVELTPDFADDPAATRIYRRYLARVESEDLLSKLPRAATAKYSGTASCLKCHAKASEVWKASAHAHALRTLITEGHGRDPDCVRCHVVGLESAFGFRSVKSTPQLANVGCESCHGPGAAHAAKPYKANLPKMGEKACTPCHVSENSPGFEFGEYWKKVRH